MLTKTTRIVLLFMLAAISGLARSAENVKPATASAPQATTDKAEGFGATAKGGEGGKILTVTSLGDSGAGTLREALSAKGPRIIRFDVQGKIALLSRLRVTEGQLTVDGSTAPGEGITLQNHGIQFVDCQEVIVRNLRIRVTTGGESGDCVLLWGKTKKVQRVLIDHCSLMGATDEIVNTWGDVEDATFQWCIVARGKPPHSKAWLSGAGSTGITIHHCLLASCDDRNPKLEGGRYEVIHNVIAHWANNNAAKIRLGAQVNIVNNVFVPGPSSAPQKGCIFLEDPAKDVKLFVSGNLSPTTPLGENPWSLVTLNDQASGEKGVQPAPERYRSEKPLKASLTPVTTQPADMACDAVLDRAGAKIRDKADEDLVKEVRQGWADLKNAPRKAP